MIRILIVYGTTHGQTAKIATDLSRALRGRGATIDVVAAGSAPCPRGDTDTTRDFEYTDWKDLRLFAELFFARVAAETDASTAIGA